MDNATIRSRVLLLFGLLSSQIQANIPIDKITAEAYSDIGNIVEGSFGGAPVKNQYLSRLGLTMTASDTVNGKLRLTVGVGGIFYQPLPSVSAGFWQKSLKFAPRITEASSEVIFTPNLSLEQGYFSLKYNSSAMDLGEYLIKSESYPTYLSTGEWTWVDSASTHALGMRLKASHFDGKFQHEVGIYLELGNSPFFDITPAYLFAWKPAHGIEIGGGIALRRWFTPNSSSPYANLNDEASDAAKYVTIANFPDVQNQAEVFYTYDDGTGGRASAHAFAVWNPASTLDTTGLFGGRANVSVTGTQMIQDGSAAGTRVGIKKFLQNLAGCSADSLQCTTYMNTRDTLIAVDAAGVAVGAPNSAQVTQSVEITRKAINVMAHVTFDFTQMFGWGKRYRSCALYGEWAVLGTQNQPVYYQNILQRMPVLVGLHVPTFGLLDLLALETEYLDNPYPDSYQQLADQPHKVLLGSDQAIPDMDYTLRKFTLPSVHGDDWKWCVFAVRTLLPGLKLKVKAANDHVRMQYFDVDATAGAVFGAISPKPQTTSMSQWYYVAHLEWGF